MPKLFGSTKKVIPGIFTFEEAKVGNNSFGNGSVSANEAISMSRPDLVGTDCEAQKNQARLIETSGRREIA